MAKNILNGYAVKAFSEHPSTLWPLDDDVFFLSLISESDRLFSNWGTPVNATKKDYTDITFVYPDVLSPFNSDEYSVIEGSGIPSPIYISNISGNGTLITYTTSSNHGLTVGQTVSIIGTIPAQYSKNNVTVFSTPALNSFTVQATDTGAYTSGGEVRYNIDIEIKSNIAFLNSDLDPDRPSFCVNQYIRQECIYVNYYEVGYSYVDSLSVTHEVVNRITTSENGSWINFNNTYPVTNDTPTDFKLIFRVNVSIGGVDSDYKFYMNGLSVGHWSEISSSRSLGSQIVALPPSSGVALDGVPADQYGILSNNAYYVVENNKLLSQNNNSPMIFGTESLTRIIPSISGNPSLIFPAMGMLNESGRHKNQTLEMWIRVNPNTNESRRILGPVDGDYGVYVRDNTISLLVGNNFSSHYISQWYRPMLLHIVFNNDSVSMMINGERVASVEVDRTAISLPNSFDELNYGPDWWGVYSYSDINNFDIDCISIYPYAMSDQVAKKRFVWGQGTPSITSINNQYLGTSIYFDYSNSNYSVNAIYPDAYSWSNGYFNNFTATKNSLSNPDYSLPEVYIEGRDIQEWYSANNEVNTLEYPDAGHTKFITFRPNQYIRTNLVKNPSFEVNTTGWTTNATSSAIRSTAQSYSGTASFRLTYNGGGAGGVFTNCDVIGGREYTFSIYVRENNTTRSHIANFQCYDAGNVNVGNFSGTSTSCVSGQWTRVSITATVPETTTRITVSCYTAAATISGNTAHFDAALMEESGSVGSYFDGSTQNAIWSGTANASVSSIPKWTYEGDDWNENSYIYFDSLNVLTDPVSAIYGVFEANWDIEEERTLMFFRNSVSNSTFSITIKRSDVYYKFNGNSIYINSINIDEHFAVGINFQNLASYFGNQILDFFGFPSYVQMYVGGDGSTTFEGKIYRIGFSNQYNYQEISDFFLNNGVAIASGDEVLTEHFASYTLMPIYRFNRLFLDISISSQWEEYYPLSYFSKKVSDAEGNEYYDVDMLQINLDYSPISSIVGGNIDTTGSALKTYLTFQSLIGGANDPISNYPTTELLPERKVIDANSLPNFDAYDRKFEFCDNTIVIPPKMVNINNIAMTVFFDLKQEGIISNPITIRNFEIASNAFDNNQFKSIGTRYGVDAYPYRRDGLYYSSKNVAPFTITKKNTPYLYSTENSGIHMIEESTDNVENGFLITVNKNSADVSIGAMQLWINYRGEIPQTPKKIFNINGKTQTIEFMLVADNYGERGIIYARDAFTKTTLVNMKFYQNGVYTSNPIIFNKEWVCLGISFDDVVDMSLYVGSISLFGGTMFNNISYYLSNGLGRNENTIVRPWIRVLEDASLFSSYTGANKDDYFNLSNERILWNYWYVDIEDSDNNPLTVHRKWANVYLINQDPSYVVTPEDIYAAFTGTNVNIVDDDAGVLLSNDRIFTINEISWSVSSDIPA